MLRPRRAVAEIKTIMHPEPHVFHQWRGLSPEGQRIIGIGIGVLLVFLAILVAFRLTAQSVNRAAFEFMLGAFPAKTNLISIGPENKDDIASMKDQLKGLDPQSADLRMARRHLLKALSYLYEELEAEGRFARMAQNREYLKAEALSKEAEEKWRLYLRELRKAKPYMERYTQETGRPAINVQLPE